MTRPTTPRSHEITNSNRSEVSKSLLFSLYSAAVSIVGYTAGTEFTFHDGSSVTISDGRIKAITPEL